MAQISEQKHTRIATHELLVKPLEPATWTAFALLAEDNNGVRGGCWCVDFHVKLGTYQIPPHRWVVTKIAAASRAGEQP